ncbi:Chondroitin proteoglycan [Dirofilaria immitis]
MIHIHIHNVALFLLIPLAMQHEKNGKSRNYQEPSDLEKHSISDFARIPEFYPNCVEGCLKPLLLTLRASFVSGNDYERLVNTCEKLREVYECMDRIKKCQDNYLFRVFMDGFEYMCIEHPAAFRDLMECMDLHAPVVIKDCEQKCNALKLVMGWIIYWTTQFSSSLRISSNAAQPRFYAHVFRKITSEVCAISECYFLCLKIKYNARCYGIGGNLFMEVMIRPIYRIHNSILLSPFMNIMKLMMPAQCDFIMTDAGISRQRIDPKLDKDLKNFYKNRTEPLVKFQQPRNTAELEKSVFRDRAKRTIEETDMEAFIMVKNKNETEYNEQDSIGEY